MKAPNSRSIQPAKAVAAAVLGVVALVGLAWFIRDYVPHHNWLFSGHYALGFGDLLSRKRDIFRIHHGSNVYSLHDHHQYFTYPPAALFIFWPLSWANFHVDVLIWTLACLFALAGSIAMVWRAVRPDPMWTVAAGSLWGTVAAVVAFPVISIGLALGQLGLLLMVMLALDYLVLRGPAKGVLTGIAAAIKIYPVVFIVGWLIRREWRPALTALASGALTSAVAWAVWPTFTATFVSRQLFSGRELTHFLNNLHWRATSSSPYTIFFPLAVSRRIVGVTSGVARVDCGRGARTLGGAAYVARGCSGDLVRATHGRERARGTGDVGPLLHVRAATGSRHH